MLHLIPAFFQEKPVHEVPEETADFPQQERHLRKWEENLRRRETAWARKNREIEKHRQQQEVCYRQLKDFSQQMDLRQAELDRREEALSLQKESLERAIARYCQERSLWQQQRPDSGYPELDNQMDQLRQDFRSVRNDLGAAQNTLVRLIDQVQQIQNQGIEEICWLHRDAAAIPTEEGQRFAARLCVILRESFGAEPIEPSPGDPFDSTVCECGSGSGRTVTVCLHRGWVWNGGIFRAIVALH